MSRSDFDRRANAIAEELDHVLAPLRDRIAAASAEGLDALHGECYAQAVQVGIIFEALCAMLPDDIASAARSRVGTLASTLRADAAVGEFVARAGTLTH